MAIKIQFNGDYQPENPTIIITKRSCELIAQIPMIGNVHLTDNLNSASELTFDVYKYNNQELNPYWSEIKEGRNIYVKEWNKYFRIKVETTEDNSTIKNVSCTALAETELSDINLYNIEINTESDIARDDYDPLYPTVLYNPDRPSSSLLHRISDKIPHYTFGHIDSTIANIQRTFSFDGTSIYDALQEVAEEINCIFICNVYRYDGKVIREISAYDLESYCYDCQYRGEFEGTCPECNSTNIRLPYKLFTSTTGDQLFEDTNIYVTSDALANSISLTPNSDDVKNCFKLEAGDDLMTAAIISCSPNLSGYLWHFSDDMKNDMSEALQEKLNAYDEECANYQKEKVFDTDSDYSLYFTYQNDYNTMITYIKENYSLDDPSIFKTYTNITGTKSVAEAIYNITDVYYYLNDEMMPSINLPDSPTAKSALSDLETAFQDTKSGNNIVSVQTITYGTDGTEGSVPTLSTANSAILGMAKVLGDSTRFKITVNDGATLTIAKDRSGNYYKIWKGSFTTVLNSANEDQIKNDTEQKYKAVGTNIITITINTDYENFIKNKIDKTLNKSDTEDYSMSSLVKKSLTEFTSELHKYSLTSLQNIYNCIEGVLSVLQEQGIASVNSANYTEDKKDIYDNIYTPYYNKSKATNNELNERSVQVTTAQNFLTQLSDLQSYIATKLNMQKYLGDDLWKELCSYRKEDTYSNSNYVTDGLSNEEIINKAEEFLRVATSEIAKSCEITHSISTTLNNLLLINEFSSLVDYFSVGNYIHVGIDDQRYKLQLLSYSIDYDNPESIEVEFSDAIDMKLSQNAIKDILDSAQSIATTYDTVQRQASQGADANKEFNLFVSDDLDMTNQNIVNTATNQTQEWNENGILCRQYDDITESYNNIQMRILNSTIAITKDNWETIETALGEFVYYDPTDNEYKTGFGVVAQQLVGNIILGSELGIYSQSNKVQIDQNGLTITANGDDSNKAVFTIKKQSTDESGQTVDETKLSIDKDGNLIMNLNNILVNTGDGSNNQTLNDKLSSISITEDQIKSTMKSYTETDQFKEYVESNIIQNSESLTVIAKKTTQLKQDIDDVNNNLSEDIDDINTTLEKYFIFDTNGLTIKSGNSNATYMNLSNNQLTFKDSSDNNLAWFSDSALNVNKVVVNNELDLGTLRFVKIEGTATHYRLM